jgi:hypothetical protein
MAHTAFTHDEKPSMDAPLEVVGNGASALEKPIRIRLQPDLYNWETRTYEAWYGLTWKVEVQDVAEGRRLRQALADLFTAFGGNERQQTKVCRELGRMAEGMRD